MSRKLSIRGHLDKSVAEVFSDFVISQTAKGLAEITLSNYRNHIYSISNHLDIQKPFSSLRKKDVEHGS